MSRRPIRGVLFDKDGTLVDFQDTWLPAYQAAAARVAELAGDADLADRLMADGGWDESRGGWRAGSLLTSASNREIVARWAELAGFDGPTAIADAVADTFHSAASTHVRALPGIAGLLSTLAERGIRLGIATMDSERTALTHAQTLGIDSLLDFVCGADSGHGEKPGPGMLQAFCRFSGLDPEDVMMVGDSPHDLNMGRAAGAGLVVGVLSGAHALEDLRHLADYVVEDATRILEIMS